MTYNNDSSFDARLKPGAEALAAFNQDYIKRVLANARADIIEMDGECSKVADELNKLIYHSEGLHVRSLVVNSGGSPVSLTPWAALRLFSSGNQPDFVVPLHGSEGSYPSIKPGESQQLDFDSIETVEQIEMKYPGIENILKSETILSRLALKRADLAGDGGWITTATRTLTANEDAEPEARRVGAALKK